MKTQTQKQTEKAEGEIITPEVNERIEQIRAETAVLKANIRAMRAERVEKNRPTVWVNSKNGNFEIHFENKTILGKIDSIDRETSREDSDRMAEGSQFKQLTYNTEVEEDGE